MDNKSKMLAAGAAFLLSAGVAVGAYFYTKKGNQQAAGSQEERKAAEPTKAAAEETKAEDDAPVPVPAVEIDPNWEGFTDPFYKTNKYLSKIEAASRSELISDVNYTLALGLLKGGESFTGKVTIEFSLRQKGTVYVADGDNSKCVFLDFKGKLISSIVVNG